MPACQTVEVIQAIDHELLTHEKLVTLHTVPSQSVDDPEHDILKISVVNRYENTSPALAYVNGFGLIQGAIASSVAHDSHNLLVVGRDVDDMVVAAIDEG